MVDVGRLSGRVSRMFLLVILQVLVGERCAATASKMRRAVTQSPAAVYNGAGFISAHLRALLCRVPY